MRTLNVSFALGGLAFALSTQLGGCNAVSDDCSTYETCPAGGSSGTGGTEGESGAPGGGSEQGGQAGKGGANAAGSNGSSGDAGTGGHGGGGSTQCDTSKSPRDEHCLVSDEFAVFVSPGGDDDNAGTQDAPFATLTKAAESAGDLPVLVCNGTYDEHVAITNGVSVYGGFNCSDWTAEEAKPLFKPSTAGTALNIDTVTDSVLIENVGFEVGDAVAAGATALTAIVNASPKVTLSAVALKAGKGKPGTSGLLASFDFPDKATLKGNDEKAGATGGGELSCACQVGLVTTGGVGGTPSSTGQSGAKGGPSHGPAGGEGGDPSSGDCGSGSSGKKGANAPAAAAATGASRLGTATATGWQPSPGLDGSTGLPGQGGGGGASFNTAGHGGGGGCGGCGGSGGGAGKGGGASIALLAVGSPVLLRAANITTADAGNGGAGASGQAGQKEAGSGGIIIDNQNSCGGGAGGFGGDGAAGGGGAGGISVGVLWSGAIAPTVSADTGITTGKPGAKGVGGVPTNDGIAGVAQNVLKVD